VGKANSRKGDGTLSRMKPTAEEPCDIFVYDPEVPVLAPGGPGAPSGQFDQAALELGNNLLVYTTEPLAKPMLIFGSPHIILYCATSAAHSDFTAKLVACVRTARLSSSAWELRVQAGFFASRVIPRTEFISGISILNQLPAD